jgi:hypothetical protein
MMSDRQLVIRDRTLTIRQLEIPEPEVVEYINRLCEDERESALVQSLHVGVFCLQRAKLLKTLIS